MVTRDVSAMDYDELMLLAEVHRLVGKVIELAGGSVPPVGTASRNPSLVVCRTDVADCRAASARRGQADRRPAAAGR